MKLLMVFLIMILATDKMAYSDELYGLHNSTKVFTPNSEMVANDWSDPKELERVWQSALVRIPSGKGKYIEAQIKNLDGDSIVGKFPTVIYLHGCSGVWEGTLRRINFLAENGFAVVAPVSLARQKYPKSCDVTTHKGGMYRKTVMMRQIDAENAILKTKDIPWADDSNIFLVGLSEGALTTATFKAISDKATVNARVVEGWTCKAGWREYIGINAPDNEPVLTLVAEKDPWFQDIWTKGDCGGAINITNGSESIVYSNPPLVTLHALLEHQIVKDKVLTFLRLHMK